MIDSMETQVLSACLIKESNLFSLMQYDRDLFLDHKNQKIFDIMKDVYEKNEKLDSSVLFSHIEMLNDKSMIASDVLYELNTHYETMMNFDYTLRLLAEKRDREKIALLCKDLYQSAKKGMEYDQFVNELTKVYEKKFEDSSGCIDLNKIEDLDDFFSKTRFHRTGIKPLDDVLCGMFNGEVTIVAARPGLGKTTIALQIARQMKTLFFSLEMKHQIIYAKLLSSESDVETWKVLTKKMSPEERERVLKAHFKLKDELKITLFDDSENFSEILSKAKIYQKLKGAELIVVDYVQLIHGGLGENNNLRIANVSRQLKRLAMQLNIPILLLSQLNRNSMHQGREPDLQDLRDSGSLEQDAGQVIFIWEKDDQTRVRVAKNRLGRVGKVENVMFVKEYSRFDVEVHFQEMKNPDYFND